MPIITICSSASFYQKAVEIQAQLEQGGYKGILPATAEKMKQTRDFEVSQYKTWYANADDYHKKAALMRGHFAEIEKADAILVLNSEKNGIKNYIGGNVLMEMAIAFHLKKPIFLYNGLPDSSPYLEEILGLLPIVLNGDLQAISLKQN